MCITFQMPLVSPKCERRPSIGLICSFRIPEQYTLTTAKSVWLDIVNDHIVIILVTAFSWLFQKFIEEFVADFENMLAQPRSLYGTREHDISLAIVSQDNSDNVSFWR